MNEFDVVIIGGGVSGCSTFYTLSEYSNIKKIAIVEKESQLAQISSSHKANSQTIHDGSIETNYSAEKASKVRIAANKVRNFMLKENLQNKMIFNMQKIAIGVGDIECDFMTKRHEVFKDIFPGLQFYTKEQIKVMEPKVIEGKNGLDRPENVVASGFDSDWCAVNYESLSEYFVQKAKQKKPQNEIFLNFHVERINVKNTGYSILGKDGKEIYAKFVLVDAGSYSLPLAQKAGYGLDLGCLPVGGEFYFTPKLLNGKVYGVQNPKLPFAALHGDPDVFVEGKTRLGPTALATLRLENSKHFFDVLSPDLLKLDLHLDVFKATYNLISDAEIRNYILRNIAFHLPFFGKRLFIQDAQKIIPSLKLEDITFAQGYGEVRPQVLDRTTKRLELGEKKIRTGKGLTFNMTPSPGATSCLHNALIDSEEIVEYLNATLEKERFLQELSPDELR
ncbi:FAD-dependent oxidoreductase [Helicobacter aurati]|uniref:malate dehydrogenase (quinone) n=1 Tax=Helicobacter aurati TaxID=137778 RepID=A0A3D8J194_9HELI|nr:FAD-dependent oxidoreductase [Helicobacter aurati]RDU71258.1 FAD-dependent oxidoreductase [Helicobacter aurati]